jgi:hypothetical protein
MKPMLDPGAGAAVTGLFLGSLAIAGAVALVTAPITPRAAVARDQDPGARISLQSRPLAKPLVSPVAAVQIGARTNPDD